MDKGFLNNLVWVPKLVCGRLKPLGYNTGSVSGGGEEVWLLRKFYVHIIREGKG